MISIAVAEKLHFCDYGKRFIFLLKMRFYHFGKRAKRIFKKCHENHFCRTADFDLTATAKVVVFDQNLTF